MFKNYFRTALRLFWKNKSFSFINVGGLALSMAVCLLLIMIIKDANEYDKFHPNSDRVYRINTDMLKKDGNKNLYATSPYMVASTLASNYTGIENWTMFSNGMNKEITADSRKFQLNMHFTNSNFFNLFGFTLKEGNAATALTQPYTIVLTDDLTTKLFPAGNAIGKSVKVDEVGLFKVTGVMNKFPGKTHFEFEALASFNTIPSLEKDSIVQVTTGNWNNFNSYNYIRLKPGITSTQAEAALDEITKNNYQNLSAATTTNYRFKLQSLNAITPGPMLGNNMGKALSSGRLWVFSLLAFIIIISAAFNYTNLTIAKAMSRMKEIAMRKVVGSSGTNIFLQIVVESVITSLIALSVAFILLQFLIPQFSSLGFIHAANISFTTDAAVILLFIAFAIVLGIVAGVFPASVLSQIQPLLLMQKLQNLNIFRHLGLRKTLLIFQFMISLIFISLVTIAYKQTQFQINTNFGSKQTNILNVRLQDVSYDKAVEKFSSIPGVEKISAVSTLMGSFADWEDPVRISKDKEPITLREYFTDENYISNFNLKLIAGENFPADHQQKQEKYAIVNEKFVEQFKLGKPIDAVGKTILVGDSTELIITGVLKDFLFKPSKYVLEPMLMRYNPQKWPILNLSISSGSTMKTTAQVQATWKKLDPYHSFQGMFYDDEIQSIFSDNLDTVWMIGFIGIIAIVIACLGLLGITIFTIQSKVKEISVRKVMGAGAVSLIRLLSKTYIRIIIIAIVLAIPITILLGTKLLQGQGQHIDLNAVLFIPGIIMILLLSLVTISSQVLRAAFINPVHGLREE